MLQAWSSDSGLARISPARTTVVSEPSTSLSGLSGLSAATARAFSRASRSTYCSGDSPSRGVSSMSAGQARWLTPIWLSSSARRGEADARIRPVIGLSEFAVQAVEQPRYQGPGDGTGQRRPQVAEPRGIGTEQLFHKMHQHLIDTQQQEHHQALLG